MGRPAKSAIEHELYNTPSHAKLSGESHVPAGRPKFPKDVPVAAKKVFKDLCRVLEERRALTRGDYHLLRIFCLTWERHKRNAELLRAEGEITTYVRLDSNGQPHNQVKQNIRLELVVAAEKQMASILVSLGLTPTAKDRAKPVAPAELKPELVEGSVAHYLATQRSGPKPIPVSPEDMLASDEEA